jgi:hypothetical protein
MAPGRGGQDAGTARTQPSEFNRGNAELGAADPYCFDPTLVAELLAASDRALGSDA